jgi:hypothetical protein
MSQRSPTDFTVLADQEGEAPFPHAQIVPANIPQLHLLPPHHLRPRSAPLPITLYLTRYDHSILDRERELQTVTFAYIPVAAG